MAKKLYARDVTRMIALAADHYRISVEVLLSPCRWPEAVRARQAVMLTLRGRGWSYQRITEAVGRSDHTTAIHGIDAARYLRSRDGDFVELLEKLLSCEALPIPDCDRPRAAPNYFPYAHLTMAEVTAAEELEAGHVPEQAA